MSICVDQVEQRVGLVEAGVEIDDVEVRLEACEAEADIQLDVERALGGKPVDADQAEAVDVELAGEIDAQVAEVASTP